MLHLARSARWRQTFVWSCVPYLVLCVFADFLHAHPLLTRGPASAIQQRVATPSPATQIPDAACAICQWQRVSPRLQAAVVSGPATGQADTLVVAAAWISPNSPVPLPSAFRGPPSPSLS